MNAPETARRVKNTSTVAELYMALELSDAKWVVYVSDGARAPSHYTVAAGDMPVLLAAIEKAKARCGLAGKVVVHSCYEAGRDGYWLHRWLIEQGMENIVVDSASIEVNRRRRRAKTDHLDGAKLLAMLMRYHAGERRVWSVVHVPTLEQEDARRAHRELQRLGAEHTAHSNRIGSLLVLQGVRVKNIGGRAWQRWWQEHSAKLAPCLRAEIEREMARLALVKAQIKAIEDQQREQVAAGMHPLHRWLIEQGMENIVVDSASIEVNRRRRRAKTDHLDGAKLLAMLMRYHAGERRVWSVVHVPTLEQEDARRAHRELQRLGAEHTAHSNRIGSLLVLQGVRVKNIGGRAWQRWWQEHSAKLAPCLRAEIEREMARLALVKAQIKAIEDQQREQVAAGMHPQVAQLERLRAIGLASAWVLSKELFGWRVFRNRREVAGSLGLAPTPYNSGESQTEQGIAKAGNKRARWLLVELAWSWLRYQPNSAMSQWFNERFAHGGKRMRRIGIVALARRLAIALWRYLQFAEIPGGAQLKTSRG